MPGSIAIEVAEVLPGELDADGRVVLRVIDAAGQSFNLVLPRAQLGALLAALPTEASPTHPAHTPEAPPQPVRAWSVGAEADGRAVALTLVTDVGAVARFAMTAGQIDSIASLSRFGLRMPERHVLN